MSCRPERVTAYVDGALDGAGRAEVEAHLAEACPACRGQVGVERSLRLRVRSLPEPTPPHGIERRLRALLSLEPQIGPWVMALAAVLGLLTAVLTPVSPRPGLH